MTEQTVQAPLPAGKHSHQEKEPTFIKEIIELKTQRDRLSKAASKLQGDIFDIDNPSGHVCPRCSAIKFNRCTNWLGRNIEYHEERKQGVNRKLIEKMRMQLAKLRNMNSDVSHKLRALEDKQSDLEEREKRERRSVAMMEAVRSIKSKNASINVCAYRDQIYSVTSTTNLLEFLPGDRLSKDILEALIEKGVTIKIEPSFHNRKSYSMYGW